MAKEEGQVAKIRELIKERKKIRVQRQRKAPAPKRRKLNDQEFEPRQDKEHGNMETNRGEEKKKVYEESTEVPQAKRHNVRTSHDIREMLRSTAGKDMTAPLEQEIEQTTERQETPETTPAIHYGPETNGKERVNWEENFRLHIKETRRLDK